MQRHYRSLLSIILSKELSIVKLSENDFGLYASDAVNTFGTPLMVRGTKEEIDEFMAKHKLPRSGESE